MSSHSYQNLEVVEQTLPLCAAYLEKEDVTVSECCHLDETISAGSLPYELKCEQDYLSMNTPGIGRYLLCMVAQAILFFILVIATENNVFMQLLRKCVPPPTANAGVWCAVLCVRVCVVSLTLSARRPTSRSTLAVGGLNIAPLCLCASPHFSAPFADAGDPEHEDEDVRNERRRIMSKLNGPESMVNAHTNELTNVGQDDVLVVQNLSKVFNLSRGMCQGSTRKVAVDRMYLGVGRGECFGLLGVNGAGRFGGKGGGGVGGEEGRCGSREKTSP